MIPRLNPIIPILLSMHLLSGCASIRSQVDIESADGCYGSSGDARIFIQHGEMYVAGSRTAISRVSVEHLSSGTFVSTSPSVSIDHNGRIVQSEQAPRLIPLQTEEGVGYQRVRMLFPEGDGTGFETFYKLEDANCGSR